jgi:hypothetical protein
MAGIVLGFCTIAWLHTPPSKAKELKPLLIEIENYKVTKGVYPKTCTNFASFSNLTNQFKIFVGSGSDIPLDACSDVALLLNENDYKIYFPVSGGNPLDFTAWRYDSNTHYWRKGRIRTPIWGSSWSIQWKPSFP